MAKKAEILISELFLESATNRQTINRVFNFEIPSGAAHAGGSVFGIIKIDSIHPVYERLVDGFLDAIEKFYQEEHNLDFAAEFEKSLQTINKTIFDFIGREANPIDLSKINILICASSEDNLSFTAIGSVNMLFFQKQDGKGFRVFDLTKNIGTKPEEIKTTKLFENVMYGSIQPGDVIIIANPELLETFSEERLQPIITGNKPAESVALLRDQLLSSTVKGGYTAIIIQYHEEPIPVGTEAVPKNFQGSLEHLKTTEQETSKYLVGGGSGVFSKIFSTVTTSVMSILPAKSPKYEEKIAPAPRELPKKIIRFFVWLGAVIVKAFTVSLNFIKNSAVVILNLGGRRKDVLSSYKSDISTAGNRGVSWFNALGKMNKSIFIVALIIILIFIWSLIYLNYRGAKEEEVAAYNSKVIEITQKKDEAESSLIYGDEERARELVEEALVAIAELPDKKRDQREIKEGLIADIEKLRGDLRHETAPDDLEKITDLPQPGEGETLDFAYYLYESDSRFLALSKNKDLYIWLREQDAWQKVDWENEEIQSITASLKIEENKYLVIDARPGISEVDTADLSWKVVDFATSDGQKQFVDLASWNRNLYILDPGAGQIFKHNYTASGYGAGSAWISSSADINDAVSVAIDGSIYILKSNGEVYKFYTGTKENWSITAVDPPLVQPTKIWTHEDIDYIYILEPTNKRVVVVDKDGKLKNQYKLNDVEGIKDFYIDRSARKIWVMAGNGIWKFGFDE